MSPKQPRPPSAQGRSEAKRRGPQCSEDRKPALARERGAARILVNGQRPSAKESVEAIAT